MSKLSHEVQRNLLAFKKLSQPVDLALATVATTLFVITVVGFGLGYLWGQW